MLDREAARVIALSELKQRQVTVVEFNNQPETSAHFIQYYSKVSAGTGEVIYEDAAPEHITIPDIPEYRRAACVVKASGHNMKPLYNDGDMLLIEPACVINVGKIGIFNVNEKAYLKKYGETELISLNKDYEKHPAY